MTIKSRFLSLICFVVVGHAEAGSFDLVTADSGRPPLVKCRQNNQNGKLASQYARLNRIFSELYLANLDSFRSAKIPLESICINIQDREDRPLAFTIVQTGELVVNNVLVNSDASDEVLAGIMSHELAHLLLFHPHPSQLPYNQRQHLSAAQLDVAEGIKKIREDLVNSRFYRGSILETIPAARLAKWIENTPALQDLLATLMAGRFIFEEATFYQNPYLIRDDLYSQLFEMAESKNYFGDSSAKKLFDQVEQYHKKTLSLVAELTQLENILSEGHFHFDYSVSPQSVLEDEADMVGFQLFSNAGYSRFDSMSLFLMKHWLPDSNSFANGFEYCRWYEVQNGIAMDNSGWPHLCWRLARALGLQKGMKFPFQPTFGNLSKYKKLKFAVAITSGIKCNATPFIMPGMDNAQRALFITSGHCLGRGKHQNKYPDKNEFMINLDVDSSVQLTSSMSDFGHAVGIKKIVFGTMTNTDLAILESNWSYADLRRLGYPIYLLSKEAPILNEKMLFISAANHITRSCTVEAHVPVVLEGPALTKNITRMRNEVACLARGGDSGSAGFSQRTGEILTIAQTINTQAESSGKKICELDSPCELNGDRREIKANQLYASPVFRLYGCYHEAKKKFNFAMKSCELTERVQ